MLMQTQEDCRDLVLAIVVHQITLPPIPQVSIFMKNFGACELASKMAGVMGPQSMHSPMGSVNSTMNFVKREFCAECFEEFMRWSIRHAAPEVDSVFIQFLLS